jgi:Fe-S-cluster containining protein
MDLITIWRNRRLEEKTSHKKFITRIKKSRDKSINALADSFHAEVFDELDCLDCANCCTSIPPIINETDVKRAAKFLGIRPADFKDQYVRIDEDQDMVMKTSPCPFLESDNKCFIYDGRPRACREYPHTDNHEFLKNLKLHSENSFYCPAVFHILERMKAQL